MPRSRSYSSESGHHHYQRSRSPQGKVRPGRKRSVSRRRDENSSRERNYRRKIISDIRHHFKFESRQLKGSDQTALIKELSKKIEEQYGPIKITTFDDDQSGTKVFIGFNYDEDALKFLNHGQYTIERGTNRFGLKPKPTFAFRCLLFLMDDDSRRELKKYRSMRRKNSGSPSQRSQYESNESSERGSLGRHKRRPPEEKAPHVDPYRRRRNDSEERRSPQKPLRRSLERRGSSEKRRSYSPRRQGADWSRKDAGLRKSPPRAADRLGLKEPEGDRILLFGLPTRCKDNEIFRALNKVDIGVKVNFIRLRRFQNTNAEYYEMFIDRKLVGRLMEVADKFQVQDNPVIILHADAGQEVKIRQRLREYQITIQFPKKVHPSHVYRNLQECGSIVQMVYDEKEREKDRSGAEGRRYTVTFSSATTATQFKKLEGLSSGITIKEPMNGQLVYRPTYSSQLIFSEVAAPIEQNSLSPQAQGSPSGQILSKPEDY